MSQHVVHFLGFMGLVETIVEFVYIFALRDAFTPFEGIFFLADGTCEIVGELFAVVLGGRHVFQEYRGNVNVVDMFVVALKDPIHNMAYPHPSSDAPDKVLLSAASMGITVSNLSLFVWAIFFPFWGDFQGEDAVRVLLSALSCLFVTGVLVVNALDARRIQARGESREVSTVSDTTWIGAFSAKYALRKAFGVYLVISNSDRLAPDELGYALIGFQVLELASVSMVLLKAFITNVYDGVAAEMPRQVGERCFEVFNCMSSFLRCCTSSKTAAAVQEPPYGEAPTHTVSDELRTSPPADGMDHRKAGFFGLGEMAGVERIMGYHTAGEGRLDSMVETGRPTSRWPYSVTDDIANSKLGVSRVDEVPRARSFTKFSRDVGVVSPQPRVARAHSFAEFGRDARRYHRRYKKNANVGIRQYGRQKNLLKKRWSSVEHGEVETAGGGTAAYNSTPMPKPPREKPMQPPPREEKPIPIPPPMLPPPPARDGIPTPKSPREEKPKTPPPPQPEDPPKTGFPVHAGGIVDQKAPREEKPYPPPPPMLGQLGLDIPMAPPPPARDGIPTQNRLVQASISAGQIAQGISHGGKPEEPPPPRDWSFLFAAEDEAADHVETADHGSWSPAEALRHKRERRWWWWLS